MVWSIPPPPGRAKRTSTSSPAVSVARAVSFWASVCSPIPPSAQIHNERFGKGLRARADPGQDSNRLAVLLPPSRHSGTVGRPQAAFDLHRRCWFTNQKVHSRGKPRPQIQQVAHDRHQHALLVLLRFPHRTKEIRQIVDLAPVHNNHVKLVFLNQRQCRFAIAHNLRRHPQVVQYVSGDPRELYVGAKQQSAHFKCRLSDVFHLSLPCCY